MFVVSAVDGVEVQHELIWDIVEELGLPRLFVINKLDRERASFENTLQQLQDAFGNKPFPLHLPVGEEQEFKGVVDLLKMQCETYDQNNPKGSTVAIPDDLSALVEEHRGRVVEAAAEADDTLLEKYLETGDLDEKEIAIGLAEAVAAGATAPVLVASATHLVGIDLIADEICALVPSPLERPEVVGTSKVGRVGRGHAQAVAVRAARRRSSSRRSPTPTSARSRSSACSPGACVPTSTCRTRRRTTTSGSPRSSTWSARST